MTAIATGVRWPLKSRSNSHFPGDSDVEHFKNFLKSYWLSLFLLLKTVFFFFFQLGCSLIGSFISLLFNLCRSFKKLGLFYVLGSFKGTYLIIYTHIGNALVYMGM